MRPESRFALRALAALVLVTLAWALLSPAYLLVLRQASVPLGGAIGVAVSRGPSGASPWLIPAVALIGASAARPRRVAIALCVLLAVSLAVDAGLVVASAALRLTPVAAVVVYQAAQALIPIAAVVVFTGGRPQALWAPAVDRPAGAA